MDVATAQSIFDSGFNLVIWSFMVGTGIGLIIRVIRMAYDK